MDKLIKLFEAHQVDFLLLFVILEAIIILFLISYLIYKKKNNRADPVITETSSPNIIIENFKKQVKTLTSANYELQKELDKYKRSGVNLTFSSAKSRRGQVSWERNTPQEPNSVNGSANNIERQQSYGGATYYSTPNGDGSERTEIDFDTPNTVPTPATPKYEYLQGINNGKFIKIVPTGEKSYFRTWTEYGIRKFEFDGNVQNALANFNATFDKICEIEGKRNGATQILNSAPGILDNNLNVTTPAKIKLA